MVFMRYWLVFLVGSACGAFLKELAEACSTDDFGGFIVGLFGFLVGATILFLIALGIFHAVI